MSSYSKIRIKGLDAMDYLQLICANDVDVSTGRIVYTQWLNKKGGIEADVTITRLDVDDYLVVSGTLCATRDMNWLKKNKPKMGWVADVVEKANERLGDRHGAIGPSYFLRDDLDDEWVESIWRHAVLPYLEEQFFGEEEQLEKFELSSLRVQSEQDSEVEASSDAGN